MVCGLEKEIHWSLSLERVNGQWKSNPICDKCRWLLIQEARKEGRFIPFFALEASQKEAAKRNNQSKISRQFVGKFGRKFDDKAKPFSAKLYQIAKIG
jgi:hypothetical protein